MIVLLGYGGWLIVQGQLTLGGLVAFAALLEQFSGQVNNVATIVNGVQQSLIGARRVFEILDAPVEVKSAPDIETEGDELSQTDESGLYHHYGLNYTPPETESGRRLARR